MYLHDFDAHAYTTPMHDPLHADHALWYSDCQRLAQEGSMLSTPAEADHYDYGTFAPSASEHPWDPSARFGYDQGWVNKYDQGGGTEPAPDAMSHGDPGHAGPLFGMGCYGRDGWWYPEGSSLPDPRYHW
jgi:hypothetical protein